MMKPNELIKEWHAGIRINVLAHYDCSKLFDRYHRLLGYTRMFLKVWHKPGIAGQPHVPPPPTAP